MKPAGGILTLILLALCASTILMEKKNAETDPSVATDQTDSRVENARRRAIPELRPLLAQKGLTLGGDIFIRIFKESKELEIFQEDPRTKSFTLLKTFEICRFSGALGPKQQRGDRQAPEGFYSVRRSAMNPQSRFHLSFDLGYPNAYDRAFGRTGDYLMVHGNCVSIGCYAMTDRRIEEIYTLADAAFANGQQRFYVHCFPFRMTGDRMAEAEEEGSEWLPFWRELKVGYDHFERDGIPPEVTAEGKHYKFTGGGGAARRDQPITD
jgi:murein L,D-transpeptidase YafK